MDIGDIFRVIAYFQEQNKQKSLQPTEWMNPYINELGPGGVAQLYGPEAVENWAKPRKVQFPYQPSKEEMVSSPVSQEANPLINSVMTSFAGLPQQQLSQPMTKYTPSKTLYPQTYQQRVASQAAQFNPSQVQQAAEIQAKIRPSAESEERMGMQEGFMKMKDEWNKANQEYRDKVQERILQYQQDNLDLKKELAGAKDDTARASLEQRWKEKEMGWKHDFEKMQLGFTNQLQLLQTKMEEGAKAKVSPDKLAGMASKIRDDARAMAMQKVAAQGYGTMAIGLGGVPTMVWKDQVKGPEMLEQVYNEEYNKMVDQHKTLGVNLPYITPPTSQPNPMLEVFKKFLSGKQAGGGQEGVVPLQQGQSATSNQPSKQKIKLKYNVPGKGIIEIDQSEVQEFNKKYPNAKRLQ